VTGLDFVRADPAHPTWRSPLRRSLEGAPSEVRDVSAEATDGPLGPAAGIAGLEIRTSRARTLLARLTDLQPPGIGAVAGVRTLVTQEGPDRYRLWFPQEYAAYMAEVALDALEGLR
jgi:hypothetical protein